MEDFYVCLDGRISNADEKKAYESLKKATDALFDASETFDGPNIYRE